MNFFKPQTLDDARNILERTANNTFNTNSNGGLIQNIKELNSKTQNLLDTLDIMCDAVVKICHFFEDIIYCISHPIEFLGALQPWLLIALMAMIILRMIGFKNIDKYFMFTLLTLILVIMFC